MSPFFSRPLGIMFHHFHGNGHPCGQGSISADELVGIIEFVGRARILSADVWMEKALAGLLDDGDICLTFDDTLRCQFDVAYEVLNDLDLKAFWFISSSVLAGNIESLELYRRFRDVYYEDIDEFYSDFFNTLPNQVILELDKCKPPHYLVEYPFYSKNDKRFRFVRDELLDENEYERIMSTLIAGKGCDRLELAKGLWMDNAIVRKLHDEGHIIGLHSHTHPTRIGELSIEAQEAEYRLNQDYLADLLGVRPVTMSHPCNSYTDDTLSILRKLRVKLGFRSNMARETASELEYPREDHANILAEIRS